jgi:hypothetical protein
VNDPDLIGLVVEPLEGIGVSYMITGGVASVIYGDPRFTRDVDVVMELQPKEVTALVAAFDPVMFYVPPAEALEAEASRHEGGHFNVIHRETALRADVDLGGDDPLIPWAFDRRMRLPVGDTEIWVAPIEYVILRKLEYYEHAGSDRHLRDVAMMLRISGETVDWAVSSSPSWVARKSRSARARTGSPLTPWPRPPTTSTARPCTGRGGATPTARPSPAPSSSTPGSSWPPAIAC